MSAADAAGAAGAARFAGTGAGAGREPLRVVIAEDSVLLREGLVRLLTDAGLEVVAAVGTAEDLLRAVDDAASPQDGAPDRSPDVAIVDVRMPPTHTDEGIRAALVLRAGHPGLGVLVLSQYVEERYATDLLASSRGRSGGIGYLLKDRVADVRDFVDAVRRVAAGQTALDPEVVGQLVARSRADSPVAALTPRERDVLGLMAEGRTNAAIAAALFVTDGAVEKHVSSIFTKLGLAPTTSDHRRVLAVLAHLEHSDADQQPAPHPQPPTRRTP